MHRYKVSTALPPLVINHWVQNSSNGRNWAFSRIASLPQRTSIVDILAQAPHRTRLTSRRPFYRSGNEEYSHDEHWRLIWAENTPANCDLITELTRQLPGFPDLSRIMWTTASLLISKHGRTQRNLHRWGVAATSEFHRCGRASQDADHLVLHYPHHSNRCKFSHDVRSEMYALVLEVGEAHMRWFDEVCVRVRPCDQIRN